jgi:heterotetrameric sarcosine oxidase gamma subunit
VSAGVGVSLEFLSPAAGASSPLEPFAAAAGARFGERDGWRVVTDYGDPEAEATARREGVTVSDRSALGKLELQGAPEAVTEAIDGAGDAALVWRSSPDRAVVVCEPGDRAGLLDRLEAPGVTLVDQTAGLAAIELAGPRARDLLERLTALDVRPAAFPAGTVIAGVVARVPAALARTGDDEYLVLVASPQAPDAWQMAIDVGAPLGLRPAGEEARARA